MSLAFKNRHAQAAFIGVVLMGLRQYLRPRVLKEFRLDSCVVTVKSTIEILKNFEIDSFPFSVRTMVFNKQAKSHLKEIENGKKMADFDDGSWSLGIGMDTDTPMGHLVTIIPEVRAIADLSLDQASRPNRDLILEPTIFTVDSEQMEYFSKFLKGEYIEFENDHEVSLIYKGEPDDQRYLFAPNWAEERYWRRIVADVTNTIRENFLS